MKNKVKKKVKVTRKVKQKGGVTNLPDMNLKISKYLKNKDIVNLGKVARGINKDLKKEIKNRKKIEEKNNTIYTLIEVFKLNRLFIGNYKKKENMYKGILASTEHIDINGDFYDDSPAYHEIIKKKKEILNSIILNKKTQIIGGKYFRILIIKNKISEDSMTVL